MAQQEEGWPLGLQPLNARFGLARNADFTGSTSFNTLVTASPTSSTVSSSDLDTESTGSFFHDKSITLGSLIGTSKVLELSKKSTRVRRVESLKERKTSKSRTWIFSLCSSDGSSDSQSVTNDNNASLAHFLAVERKAANECRRNPNLSTVYGLDGIEVVHDEDFTEANSLFVNGRVAPPTLVSQQCDEEAERPRTEGPEHSNGGGVSILFPCVCGQPS